MFSNFIRFDLKNGLLKAWKKYVIAIFVFSCFFSFHFFRVYAQNIHLQKSGETPLRFTCGDLLLSVLDGMKEFHYEDGEPFLFPALWIFVFLLLLYFTLRYPSENLGGIGKSMLILSQRRKTWYLSKCVWCVSFVLMYFAVLYLTAFLTCICLGGEVTLQPSEYAPAILNAGTYLKAPPWNILPGLFLIPCMAWHRSAPNASHLFHAPHFQLYSFLCSAALFCLFRISVSSRKLSYVLQNRDFFRKWIVYFPWLLHRFFHDRSKLCYRLPANRTNGYTRKRIRRFYF